MTERTRTRQVVATTLGDPKGEHVDHATLPSATFSQTATVTTDPDTFEVSQTFDLAGPTVYFWVATLLALDLDGETLGIEEGQFGADILRTEVSADGADWKTSDTTWWFHDTIGGLDDFAMAGTWFTPRYLRVTSVRIAQAFNGEIYAGANHPSATVRLDVTYR